MEPPHYHPRSHSHPPLPPSFPVGPFSDAMAMPPPPPRRPVFNRARPPAPPPANRHLGRDPRFPPFPPAPGRDHRGAERSSDLDDDRRGGRSVAFAVDEFGRARPPPPSAPASHQRERGGPPLPAHPPQWREGNRRGGEEVSVGGGGGGGGNRPIQPPRGGTGPTTSSATSSPGGPGQTSHSSNPCPTSAMPFRESAHGLRRRRQRNIGIRDLQSAVRYGVRTRGRPRPRSGHATSVYVHREIKYVVDDVTGEEVTSFDLPTHLPYRTVSAADMDRHRSARARIAESKYSPSSTDGKMAAGDDRDRGCSRWKSHSVLLVDRSGSMRQSDAAGSRHRLGAVWVAIARDFVAQRIETGEGGDMDVVTVILLGDRAEVLFEEMPTDWVLYNEILTIHKKNVVRPGGHGNYLPALDEAERRLSESAAGDSSCALVLAVLSDGRPSDFPLGGRDDRAPAEICRRTERLASRFGRRFTIATIGMGSGEVPGAASVGGDRRGGGDDDGGGGGADRRDGDGDSFDVLRRMAGAGNDYGSNGSFQLPSLTSSGLAAAFSSIASSLTLTQNEMSVVAPPGVDGTTRRRQRRVRDIFREKASCVPYFTEAVDKDSFDIYMGESVQRVIYDEDTKKFVQVPLQHPKAAGVAFKKQAFGEGGERLAHQFFEVAADGCTVVGAPLVAKQSRFIEEHEDEVNWEDRDSFVQKFCERQMKALRIAEEFNRKIDGMKSLDPSTPRVSFLDCSVYYLDDGPDGSESAVLVERKLNGKFLKWNSNNGFVRRADKDDHMKGEARTGNVGGLASITEENNGVEIIELDAEEYVSVTPADVAQAFSHFSFFHSGEKMLLCDLQGEFDKANCRFCFTDPVLHYYDRQKPQRKNLFGRTDQGRKGVDNFFQTHDCNCLCDLVTRGFRLARESKRQKCI